MKIIEIIPPPKTQKIVRLECTEAELVVLLLAVRETMNARDLARIIASGDRLRSGAIEIDWERVRDAAKAFWMDLYPIADPGLAILDRLYEFFPVTEAK